MKKIGKKRRFSERKRPMGLDLPEDLVFEILTRLPVRSLLQCKGVSRSWRSIISDPAFAKSQLQMSLSSSGSSIKKRVFTSRFPQRSIVYNLKDIIIFMRHRIPEIDDYDFVRVLGSQDGVVCLLVVSSSVILYNPTTTRYRSISLPDSDAYHGSWCGFGVHPISQEYLVIAQVSHFDSFRFQLFSLMTTDQATIRREIPCNIPIEEFVLGIFVNGSIHWLVRHSGNQRILRLDLTQELVGEFLTPQNTSNSYDYLSTLRGCLSLTSEEGMDSLGIWVMSDYGVNASWTRIMVIPFEAVQSHNLFPLDFKSETEILIRLDGTRIVIFNSEEESVENVYNGSDEDEEVSACVYVESLVSP